MDKLNLMYKQLILIHNELRKVKRFQKESSKHFKNFYTSMNGSLKSLSKGDIFNDIHYMNIININIIDYFNAQIMAQSTKHSLIHKRLKEEGNALKSFEKETEKRIKSLQSQFKKEEKSIFKENFFGCENNVQPIEINSETTGEVECAFKEISQVFSTIRGSIKKSFDDYLETLGSFAQTKEKLSILQMKSNENYNDCSPILDRKLDLLLNLNQGLDYSRKIACDNRNISNNHIINQSKHGEFQDNEINDSGINIQHNPSTPLPLNYVLKNSCRDNNQSNLNGEHLHDSRQADISQNQPYNFYEQLASEENIEDINNNHNRYGGNVSIPLEKFDEDFNLYETKLNQRSNQNMNVSSSHLSMLTPLKPRRIFPYYASTSVGRSKSNITNAQQQSHEVINSTDKTANNLKQLSRSKMIDAYYQSNSNALNNSRSADKENFSRNNNIVNNYNTSRLKYSQD